MTTCPHLRGEPEGTQWCALAEREHDRLEQLKDGFDRVVALGWQLEALADRMAAVCPDPVVIEEFEVWKRRRNT